MRNQEFDPRRMAQGFVNASYNVGIRGPEPMVQDLGITPEEAGVVFVPEPAEPRRRPRK